MSTFERNDTQKKVFAIVADTLNIDIKDIDPTKTIESLGADSLDRLEMVMKFEETFGITISDEQEATIDTLDQAIDIIHSMRIK